MTAIGRLVLLPILLLAAFPRPDGYVTDLASVFTDADEKYLENYLGTLERDTAAEVAVVTVVTLDGMTIEEYASRVFQEWGIGQRRHDNGVLLLVAPSERTVRIEVGYGLEGILPDGLVGEIIRTEMVPEFKAGNVPRGIGRGLDRLARILRHDPAAAMTPVAGDVEVWDDRPPAVLLIPLFGAFVMPAAFVAGLGIRTRTSGPLLWGALFGGIPLVIATPLTSPLVLAALGLVGLVVAAAGYRSGRSAYWHRMLRGSMRARPSDTEPLAWMMGGTLGGSTTEGSSPDAGGGSTSDGFGGGSSGGGGATGRW